MPAAVADLRLLARVGGIFNRESDSPESGLETVRDIAYSAGKCSCILWRGVLVKAFVIAKS